MKKIISVFVLMIILLSCFQGISFGRIQLDAVKLIEGEDIKTNVEFYDGKQWFELEAKYIYYKETDGAIYPAYCISHGLDGVDERGDYTVDIGELLDDDKVWRVIFNGYPYNGDFNVRFTPNESYFITKQAIYCVLLDRDISLYRGKTERGKELVKAIKELKDIGMDESIPAQPQANINTYKVGGFVEDGEYYSQTYGLTSTANIYEYEVDKISNFPKGTFVANVKGDPQTMYGPGETFKIMVPKSALDKDVNGTISITTTCETYPILIGKTRIENTQDYALTGEIYDDFKTSALLKEPTNTGKVEIKKVDKETNIPLEGVEFELIKEDGTKIGTATTNKEGIAVFKNLYQGNYKLQEIENDSNYVLNQVPFDIYVEYNKTAYKTISNEYKKGNLVVNKVDKDNHKIPLGNVVFDLFSNEYQRVIGTYTTDVNGKIQINDLRLGTYKLIETSTGKWYELADDVDININWNQTTEITVENELKKGQVKIIKVDAENNEIKIPGAKFEILDNNNNVLETIMTDENGEALTKKYPIRDYETIKIHEVETDKYYELDDEIKTITLEANTTKEIIFENEKIRGDIEITKISADDNEKTGEKKGTTLKGAIFEVYNENDMLVDTIVTDENGKAKSKLLEYGKYYVKEKSTGSDYYLLNTEKYYVEISKNGKTIPVTIENTSVKVEKELPKTGF